MAEAGIQWKGTDVCLDFWCPDCEHQSHIDGYFVYNVRCPDCGAVFRLPTKIAVKRVPAEELEADEGMLVGMDTSESIVHEIEGEYVEVGALGSAEIGPWKEVRRIPTFREARAAEHNA